MCGTGGSCGAVEEVDAQEDDRVIVGPEMNTKDAAGVGSDDKESGLISCVVEGPGLMSIGGGGGADVDVDVCAVDS